MPEVRLKIENILTYDRASKLLGVSRPTIYAMIDRGELHPLEIEGRRYLLKEEVERLQLARAAEKGQ